MILLTEDEIVAYAARDKTYCQLSVDVGLWVAKAQAEKIFDALNWQNCDEDFNGVACVDVNVLEELRKERDEQN